MNLWPYAIMWVIAGYVGYFLLARKGYRVSRRLSETDNREFEQAHGTSIEVFSGMRMIDAHTYVGYGVLPLVLGPFILIAGLVASDKRHRGRRKH